MALAGDTNTASTSNINMASNSETDLESHIASLPTELKLGIIEELEYPVETGRYKEALPGFSRWLDEVERLTILDRSAGAEHAHTYTCLFCMRMLEEWKFSDSELISKKARFAVHAPRRYCIECGATKLQRARTVPFHERAFPSISQPSGFGRGTPFYVRGEQFVVCQQCGELGKIGTEQPERRNHRQMLCETCADRAPARSSQESLDEVWAFAQSSQERPEDLRGLRTERWRRRAHVKSVQDVRNGSGKGVQFPEMRFVGAMRRAQGQLPSS
jgi:hypothetical protein